MSLLKSVTLFLVVFALVFDFTRSQQVEGGVEGEEAEPQEGVPEECGGDPTGCVQKAPEYAQRVVKALGEGGLGGGLGR